MKLINSNLDYIKQSVFILKDKVQSGDKKVFMIYFKLILTGYITKSTSLYDPNKNNIIKDIQ